MVYSIVKIIIGNMQQLRWTSEGKKTTCRIIRNYSVNVISGFAKLNNMLFRNIDTYGKI